MLTDNKLNRVNRSEGYAKYDRYGDGFCYNYYVKDHLGNVRLVANDYEIEQLNGYYPFGALTGDSFNYYDGEGNRFKYGGKEMQSEHRLNWYDFIARPYDPAKGSFLGIDPLAEKYPWVSPYTYCLNNPIKYKDPNGMGIVGTDGKPVTYSRDNGFSSNASNDLLRIGNEMVKTPTGMTQMMGMINHDAKITLGISNEIMKNSKTGEIESGLRTIVDFDISDDGKISIYEMDITIYEGSIDYLLEKYNVPEDVAKALKQELMGALGVHEAAHTSVENAT